MPSWRTRAGRGLLAYALNMSGLDWVEIRSWVQLVLLVVTALAAVGAVRYGRRSADAARDVAETAISSATAAEEALKLDIERLERLREAEDEARKPKVVVRIVRTPRGLDLYERAEAVIDNVGDSTATSIGIRLANLDRGIEFSGHVPALRGRGETVVPCERSGVASQQVVSQAGRRSPQGDLLPTTVPMQVDVRDHRIILHEVMTNVEEDDGGQRERGRVGTAPQAGIGS